MVPPRPQYCHPVLVTESSNFHPDPTDEDTIIPLRKSTHIENMVYSRKFANELAKEYFIRQHCESTEDSNEDDFGRPTPRARKWDIWVPKETTKCTISEVEGRCRIEVVLDEGLDRTEFVVEVAKEILYDANGPLAKDDVYNAGYGSS